MVANSVYYQTKGKMRMKKTNKPITKEEAVSILASALSYCQLAGLAVMAQANEGGALLLTRDARVLL